MRYMDKVRTYTSDQLRVPTHTIIKSHYYAGRYVNGQPDPNKTGCSITDSLGYQAESFVCPAKGNSLSCSECVIGQTLFNYANVEHLTEKPLIIYTEKEKAQLSAQVERTLRRVDRRAAWRNIFHHKSG